MENYLYFAENLVETGGAGADQEAFMVPASYYLGADPISATTTALYFKDPVRDNGDRIKVLLTHANTANSGGYKNVVRALGAAMNKNTPTNGGFVVFADEEKDNGTITGAATKTGGTEYDPAYAKCGPDSSTLTAGGGSVQITSDADSAGTYTFQTGITGDGVAPEFRRWTENGIIITQIKLDISGLTAHGATANDVIGIKSGTPVAYIYQNVVADNGIIFRTEMSCVEVPAGAGSLVEVNAVWNSSATLVYSNAGGTTYGIDSGTWAAGKTVVEEATLPTANHYLYLTEGTTDGDDSVFTSGQFIITLYGHPVLT